MPNWRQWVVVPFRKTSKMMSWANNCHTKQTWRSPKKTRQQSSKNLVLHHFKQFSILKQSSLTVIKCFTWVKFHDYLLVNHYGNKCYPLQTCAYHMTITMSQIDFNCYVWKNLQCLSVHTTSKLLTHVPLNSRDIVEICYLPCILWVWSTLYFDKIFLGNVRFS